MRSNVWGEITNPFPNFKSPTVEAWDWIRYFVPHYIMDIISHSWCNWSWSMLVKRVPGVSNYIPHPVASGLMLSLHPANERRRYKITPSHWLRANLESFLGMFCAGIQMTAAYGAVIPLTTPISLPVGLHRHPISQWYINSLRPRQNGRIFADGIFRCIFLNESIWIAINISLIFVPKGPIDNIPALVQIMDWRRSGDKPLSGPMMVRLPTHICVTRPQWVKIMREILRCTETPQVLYAHCQLLTVTRKYPRNYPFPVK